MYKFVLKIVTILSIVIVCYLLNTNVDVKTQIRAQSEDNCESVSPEDVTITIPVEKKFDDETLSGLINNDHFFYTFLLKKNLPNANTLQFKLYLEKTKKDGRLEETGFDESVESLFTITPTQKKDGSNQYQIQNNFKFADFYNGDALYTLNSLPAQAKNIFLENFNFTLWLRIVDPNTGKTNPNPYCSKKITFSFKIVPPVFPTIQCLETTISPSPPLIPANLNITQIFTPITPTLSPIYDIGQGNLIYYPIYYVESSYDNKIIKLNDPSSGKVNISLGYITEKKTITETITFKLAYSTNCQDPNSSYCNPTSNGHDIYKPNDGNNYNPIIGQCGSITINVSDDTTNPGNVTIAPHPTAPPSAAPQPLPNLAYICDQLSGAEDDRNTDRGKCYECMRDKPKSDKDKGGGKPYVWTAFGCLPADLSGIIEQFVFTTGLGLAGVISFLYFLYGSFLILTSSGNPEKIEEAKQIIVSSLSGLILIIFSVFILQVIGVDILRLPGFGK